MKRTSKIVWLWALALGLNGVGARIPSAWAQDLKAELDALDDLPEDDLSGSTSMGGGDPSAESNIPDASSIAPSQASPSAATVPPTVATAPREVGVGDLDLQGLEQELNFDSFKDGGKVALDQLQSTQDAALGGDAKGRVTSLDFKQLQDRVRLVVSADRPIDWTRELRSQRRQVIVELRNMDIAREILKRALDTGEFEGPVALVQAFPAKVGGRDSVKVLFQLRSFVDPTILRTGNDLVIDFPIAGGDTLFRSRNATRVVVPKSYLSSNDLREFKGAPISLNVKGAELGDFLNLISRSAGKNFVVSGAIGSDKKITMNLTNVPWDQALSIALFNNGLGYQDLDSVIRVATVEELQKELETARDVANKSRDLIPLETRLIPINYADVTNLQANVLPFLTKDRGNVTIEKRTNTLVVTDIPEVLEKVDRYVRAVDKQTPQVQIEARIVEAKENFVRQREFGWFNGPITTESGAQFNVGNSTTATSDNKLNLRFANLGPMSLVDVFLRFSEQQDLTRTVSSPRVTVLANETATISQGNKIIINRGADANGLALTTEVDIPTTLTVTPSVSSDGFVFMDINLQRDFLDSGGAATGARSTRSAKTKMIVESGKTAVIGGIYQQDQTDSEKGIPFLRKIPIFGSLFTNVKELTKQANELLIFISPRIINQDISRVQAAANLDEGGFSASADIGTR